MTIRNKTLNTSSLLEGDKFLWTILFFLCLVSILEVYSASSTMTFKDGVSYWSPVLKHSLLLSAGLVLTYVTHKMPPRYFGYLALGGITLSAIGLLIALMAPTELNETSRWMRVGGFSIQPSEFAKGFLIMMAAVFLSYFRDERGATNTALKAILIVSIPVCLLIFKENLSTAVMTFVVLLLMMFIGQVPPKSLGILLGVLGIVGGLALLALMLTPEDTLDKLHNVPVLKRAPVWANRLRDHVDFPPNPNDFDLNTNRQVVQAHIAVATNNFIGRGPGNSRVRDFLYHAESDFIFAIILEELGVFGGFIVMFLYVIILFRAAQIARRCDSYMSTYMVLGLALLIGLQALINMSVAVGIIPVTGQTLPMVSKGGSSILAMCLYFGIMINISRNAQKKPVLSSAEA